MCEAALDLAATGGNHAVTHQAIDKHLDLPKGSTSYYFRTRHALMTAVVAHLTKRSRARFQELRSTARGENARDGAAEVMATYVEGLVTTHRRDVMARYALATDAATDPQLAAELAASVFSRTAAVDLMAVLGADEPAVAARNLIALLEGLLVDHTFGARAHDRASPRPDDLRDAIALWLRALCAPRDPTGGAGA